jgi:hypothetical protein
MMLSSGVKPCLRVGLFIHSLHTPADIQPLPLVKLVDNLDAV